MVQKKMQLSGFLMGFWWLLLAAFSNQTLAADDFTTGPFWLTTPKQEKLSGIISRPSHAEATSIVIIVHGYGRTNVVQGDHYRTLRSAMTAQGIAVVVWDKPGCGDSEGEFDINQPIASSADEVLAAVKKLHQNEEPGSDQIGLWGVSRAGWIAPLAISQEPSIRFWISVSGTEVHENWGYLLRSTLTIAGYDEAKVNSVYQGWVDKNKVYWTGGDYATYLATSKPFWQDALVQQLTGQTYNEPEPGSLAYAAGRKQYLENQSQWMASGSSFNPKNGLEIVIKDFEPMLQAVSIPVLAIFGENDRQVDWRITKQLYEQTIGKNVGEDLVIKVFEGADHNLRLSPTGDFLETQQEDYWQYPLVDGYYELMTQWLCAKGFCAAKP
ncbi:alpha/beta hydrolase family protein [Marinicella meishanensis]|uniref:alpha/beta hydrolase family protein n=1 Tax=Marinicella meishanensis TaxID=2873263 RepID=UPI001CBBFBB4|nr:alpha/beta hydrolase [Marinicella sp. NBU2979]